MNVTTEHPYKYDLLVIGAGAAGNGAALQANEQGKSVALIERDLVGGTCTNYGCDPTKRLLYIADLLHQSRNFDEYGLNTDEVTVDWPAIQTGVRELVEEMRGGSNESLQQNFYADKGIKLYLGDARFEGPHAVSVGDELLTAAQIIIATGAEPRIPDLDGLQEAGYITNQEACYLDELPGSLAILGAGPIGVEFAQMFARFGVSVTLIEAGEQILPKDDKELSGQLLSILRDEGVEVHTETQLKRVEMHDGAKKLTLVDQDNNQHTLTVAELLIAVGRRPATGSLNLEAAGVATDDDGQIKTDATLRSSVPHIWSAGDSTATYQFTHVASQQGGFAAKNAFADEAQPFERDPIPWVTYTTPELAHVGQTASQLEEEEIPYRQLSLELTDVARSKIIKQKQGQIKLLVADEGQILGAQILSPSAGEMIGTIVMAMRAGATVDQLATSTLPYPTWVEGLKWAAKQAEE